MFNIIDARCDHEVVCGLFSENIINILYIVECYDHSELERTSAEMAVA